MSWGVKYRCEFTDILGLDWKVDIEQDGWSGSITTMQGTGDPLTIEFLGNSDELFDSPVKGSKANLNIYADTNFQWIDLYTYQDLQFRMSIYYGSTLYWRGYVITDNYSEPYDSISYEVTISAADGLGLLKNYLYAVSEIISGGDKLIVYFTGRRLESQILLDIFGKIKFTEFKEFINIYENSMSYSVDDSPMDQLLIDVDVFKDKTCYEALEEILKKYNAVIRQYLGQFIIYRPIELKSAVYGRYFTGAATKTSVSYNPEQLISRSTVTDLRDINGGTLMIQSPAKPFISKDYGYKDSWIRNYDIKSNTYDLILNQYDSWTPGVGWSRISIRGEDKGIVLQQTGGSMPGSSNVYQSFGTYAVSSSDVFIFSYDYKTENNTGSSFNKSYYIKIKSDSTNKYLTANTADFWQWSNSPAYVSEAIDVPTGVSQWITVSRQFPGLPTAGSYTITLYGLDTSNACLISYTNIRFYATSDSILQKKKKKKYSWLGILFTPIWIIEWLKPVVDTLYYKDNPEIVGGKYYPTSAIINDKEKEFDYSLGDVDDTNIDNVIEQFQGSLATQNSNVLVDTATTFYTLHAADYLPDILVTHSGTDIIFTENNGSDFSGATSIAKVSGDLDGYINFTQSHITAQNKIDRVTKNSSPYNCTVSCNGHSHTMYWSVNATQTVTNFCSGDPDYGTVVLTDNGDGSMDFEDSSDFTSAAITSSRGTSENIQPYLAHQNRIDTIILTGTSGSAYITVNTVMRLVYVPSPAVTYTTTWSTRGGSEAKPLLTIIGDELATQYSRPKHFLTLPILEDNKIDNTPHVNLIGNIQDELNQEQTIFPIKNISAWTTERCTLILNGQYSQIVVNGSTPDINIVTSFNGKYYNFIRIRYRVISGSAVNGWIYYSTAGHGFSTSYYKDILFIDDTDWHTLDADMRNLTIGGTDWITNIITKVWFLFPNSSDIIIDLDYIGFRRMFAFNKGNYNIRDREFEISINEII